ncbi:MAG: TRAP transporter large permease subunit [Deltaproteobacteria bacterium]|nr:TRAP transporter large permease subunit [Deltaproteobacteria bacterium]
MDIVWVIAVVLGSIFLLLGAGVWIAISLAIAGIIGIYFFTGIPPGKVLGMIAWNTNNSWALTCLPLFVFMGEILYRTKLSEQLFDGLAPWIYRLPGKLLHTNVLACAMFAAVSGSSAATTATIGRVTLAEFKKLNYDLPLSIGSLAGAGTLGFLIPPSIIMIIYGVLAEVSIGKLFIAGVLPGLMVAGIYMVYIIIRGLINPGLTPAMVTEYSWRDRLRSIPKIMPTVFLIALVLGSIYAGWATPTEAAACGVGGSLLVAAMSRTLNWKTFTESLMAATRTTCMICFIVTGAAFLSVAVGYLGIPRQLAEIIASFKLSPYLLLITLSVFYLILGCLLDGISMVVMTLPIVLPLITGAGFDLVWFGIFVVLMVELAQITPPVGFNLFVIQGLTGHEIGSIARNALPFFFLMLLATAILAIFPEIALWLPRLMIGR